MVTKITRIGVCGHRALPKKEAFKTALSKSSQLLKQYFPTSTFQVTSCLAEGADQLLAHHFLTSLSASLLGILPLPLIEYKYDFSSSKGVSQLESLLSQSERVLLPNPTILRPLAYQTANLLLLENSDILVAIWDGELVRGPGGTWEVVAIARSLKLPLIIILIDPVTPSVRVITENFPPALPTNRRPS
jgi:hypothetical protein